MVVKCVVSLLTVIAVSVLHVHHHVTDTCGDVPSMCEKCCSYSCPGTLDWVMGCCRCDDAAAYEAIRACPSMGSCQLPSGWHYSRQGDFVLRAFFKKHDWCIWGSKVQQLGLHGPAHAECPCSGPTFQTRISDLGADPVCNVSQLLSLDSQCMSGTPTVSAAANLARGGMLAQTPLCCPAWQARMQECTQQRNGACHISKEPQILSEAQTVRMGSLTVFRVPRSGTQAHSKVLAVTNWAISQFDKDV